MLGERFYMNHKDSILFRKNLSGKEGLSKFLSSIRFDTRFSLKFRYFLFSKLRSSRSKFLKGFKLTRPRSRCIVSGRTRFVFRYFKMARFSVRMNMVAGQISGFKKC
jgi:ribosomal protein S14